MLLAAEIVFWCCLAAVMGTYVGYPALLMLLSPFQRRKRGADEQSRFGEQALPSVSLFISAYNEEAVIAGKIKNALALDYPTEKLQIVVVSDASEDGTDSTVSRYADRGVVLKRLATRGGKTAGLTRFVPEAAGEVVVFSDANSLYEPDAIRRLVRHFADPHVGYVVGQQRYEPDPATVSAAESLYWRYETWIKERESRLGSVVGGDGAMYAIRRELFEPLREDDISDFTLPLKIVSRGYRGVYEPEAVCYERTAADFRGEFRRKARIVNRSLRAVFRVPAVLNPRRVGMFSVQLLLHKMLRWFVPLFLCGMLVAAAVPAVHGERRYVWAIGLQIAVYLTAFLRFIPYTGRLKPVLLAWYFCVVNAAAAVGILQQLFGRRIAVWTPERCTAERPVSEQTLTGTTKSA